VSKEACPSYPRYSRDYLTDENVVMMTIEDEGCYNRLMDYCWLEGSIPADLESLSKLCKGTTPSNLVISCFNHPSKDASRLLHPRLEVERKKHSQWVTKSREAGYKSASKRWGFKRKHAGKVGYDLVKATLQPNGNSSSSIAFASASSQNPPTPQRGNGAELGEFFEIFWKAYPRHESKELARKKFVSLKPARELLDSWLTWLAEAAQSEQWQDKSKIPFASTWLNQRRWEGDPPPKPAGKTQESMFDRLEREANNGK